MGDDGDTKDDVKVPDNEVGEKISRLFREEEKDTSTLLPPNPTPGLLTSVDVIVLTSMGEEVAIEAKEAPRSG